MYRLRDILLPPGLLSLVRVPLAVAFVFVADRPALALLVLFAAGVSDVLDGWVARRHGWATPTGAALDPVTDKLFVLTVAFTLVHGGFLSLWAVLLLSVRELGEAPLVAWFTLRPAARRRRHDHPKANLWGKLATVLQFLTVAWVLARRPHVEVWLAVTALAGLVAAVAYWARELR